MSQTATIDQPEGPFEFCDLSLGVYWRRGEWKRDKLRGAALGDSDLMDQLDGPLDVLRAPFRVGWMLEIIDHDGEWCDPQWPMYEFHTYPPDAGQRAERASWLELG